MKHPLLFITLFLSVTIGLSQNLRTYEGKTIDAENNEVLPFVKLQLQPSGLGTLSNSEGEFSLKIPEHAWQDELVIYHLGYEKLQIKLGDYSPQQSLEIQLEPRSYELEAVLITPQDPRDLIRQALENYADNHPFYTRKMTAFYRETSSINDTLLDIAEAVIDAYVYADEAGANYQSKVKPVKVRRLTNRSPNDTLMDINLTGSHLNPSLQKRPDKIAIDKGLELKSFMNPETFKFYSYQIKGVTEYYGRQVYIIHFDQNKRFGSKLYTGEIYLDLKTLAFARVKYQFSELGKRFRFTQLAEGFKMGLMKGLLRMGGIRIDILQHNVQIDYEFNRSDGLWHKHFVKEGFHLWLKLPKWMFNLMLKQSDEMSKSERKDFISQLKPTYSIVGSSELLITKIEKASSVPKDKSWTNTYDPLKENLVNNDDPFWKSYNYIKPSASLQLMEQRIRQQLE